LLRNRNTEALSADEIIASSIVITLLSVLSAVDFNDWLRSQTRESAM